MSANNTGPKTALVTGAAARIGASIAQALHARGCDLLLHYNSSQEAAQRLADRLNTARPNSAFLVSAELSSPAGVEHLAGATRSRFRVLDILVNNASRFYSTVPGETQAWQWDDLLNSNLRGPYFLVQALLGELRAAQGTVINLVDVHAERPLRGHAVYCISKAGMAMMTRALARELGPEIRVNGVAPGAILWPENEPSGNMQQDGRQAILSGTALGRLGEPADIAGAVCYLALDAPYVTGQILAVDGGRSLNM
ncbi:MAG: pteridine reductase [Xanthomonadales bacterium]